MLDVALVATKIEGYLNLFLSLSPKVGQFWEFGVYKIIKFFLWIDGHSQPHVLCLQTIYDEQFLYSAFEIPN